MTTTTHSPRVSILIWCLVALAVFSAIWPVYRAFLNIEIGYNEAWNAYFDDAAMGSMPLYPSPEKLIANNYPPLSFYITGALGRMCGDTVLAGRLLSLAALAVNAAGIALAIRRLGGGAAAAVVGAAFYFATMCRFFTYYAGMNDPHLLAQAVMLIGFLGFLRAMARDRGYAWPFLLMVLAGFIKHNIIVMPLTAMVWLGIHRPRQMVKSGLLAAGAGAVGFALCYAAYGADFFTNMMSPRAFEWRHALGALGHLQWVAVGLLAYIYTGITRRNDPAVQLCNLLVATGLVMFLIQKTGEGVGYNAQFELILGVSIGLGLVFEQAPLLPLARRWSPDALRALLLLAICARLLASARFESAQVLFDKRFRAGIAAREAAMDATVARIKATPGDVLSNMFACYRAGKPLVADTFNFSQRTRAGKLPADALIRLIAQGKVTVVPADPLISWSDAEVLPAMPPSGR